MEIKIEKFIQNNMGQTETNICIKGNENEVSKIIETLDKLIAETN